MARNCLRWRPLAFALVVLIPISSSAADPASLSIDGILRSMAQTLGGSTSMTVHVEKMFDDVLASGPKVQYSGALDIAVRRPDRLYVSYGDDLSAKEVWYNGAEFVLVDHRNGLVGSLPAADTIDATLDVVAEEYDVRMPLAELISSDVYENVQRNDFAMSYIGLHDVAGMLAGERTHAQLWVDAGESALPLKMVVTYVDEPGEPQQIFRFTEWNLTAELPDEVFEPERPDGFGVASFLRVEKD
jgi:hypothetical protein